MKTLKFIAALILCSTLFLSCINDQTDEELQLIIDNDAIFEQATGEDPNPPPPPPPPIGG